MEIAFVTFGLSVDQFMDLSWYEWGLHLERSNHLIDKDFAKLESDWDRTRRIICYNINPKLKKGRQLKFHDVIKLSFDDPEGLKKVSVPLTPEEVAAKFDKKGKLKKNGK